MLDIVTIRRELASKLDGLDREAKLVYAEVMRPRSGGELLGLPQTLYGYMMLCFAWIDLLSSYWDGGAERSQNLRMLNFMDRYISPHRKARREVHNVAVQCWRHKLMHTTEPRRLREASTGVEYDWLLHWWTDLPADQHYTFQHGSTNRKILNMGLIYLIADIRHGLEQYLDDLTVDQDLQRNFERIQANLNLQEFSAR